VTFVVYSLTCGGMERVVSLIVNYWAARERQVSLITIAGRSGDFFELHERVPRIALGLDLESHTAAQRFGTNWRRVRKLRKALRSTAPDAVVSFGDVTNVLTILSSLGLGVPVIVSERTDPRRHPLAPEWRALRRITYPRADAVVMQTRALTDWCREFLPMDRVRAIANPVDCSI